MHPLNLCLVGLFAIAALCFHANTPTSDSLPIVNQSAASSLPQNRLVCYQFTDVPGNPMLQAADDFMLPYGDLSNYSGLLFSFAVVRQKNGPSEPQALVLVLMRNNEATESPGTVFFQQILPLYAWNDTTLSRQSVLSVEIQNGELSSHDNYTRFALDNIAWLPRLQRLWVSFYAVGARHFIVSPRSESTLYWVTAGNDAPAPLGTFSNQCYFYVDPGNLLHSGLTVWSNASLVESLRGLDSRSLNMAWTLVLPVNLSTGSNGQSSGGMSPTTLRAIIVGSIGGVVTLAIFCLVGVTYYRRHKMKQKDKKDKNRAIPLHDRSSSASFNERTVGTNIYFESSTPTQRTHTFELIGS